jgi:hypothetical protein
MLLVGASGNFGNFQGRYQRDVDDLCSTVVQMHEERPPLGMQVSVIRRENLNLLSASKTHDKRNEWPPLDMLLKLFLRHASFSDADGGLSMGKSQTLCVTRQAGFSAGFSVSIL